MSGKKTTTPHLSAAVTFWPPHTGEHTVVVVEGLGLAAQDDGLDELVAIAGEGHPLHHWGDAQGFGFGRKVQK